MLGIVLCCFDDSYILTAFMGGHVLATRLLPYLSEDPPNSFAIVM